MENSVSPLGGESVVVGRTYVFPGVDPTPVVVPPFTTTTNDGGGGGGERRRKMPLVKTISLGTESEGGGPVPLLPKPPPKSALKKGHSRSASHGGVMNASSMSSGGPTPAPLPSALKKGHTRAASQGQIVDEDSPSHLKSHSRTASKTHFNIEPLLEKPASLVPPLSGTGKGHSRQASRSESIYTLRAQKLSSGKRRRFLFWRRETSGETSRTRTILPNHVTTPNSVHPNATYPLNLIRTTKYTTLSFLPRNLFEQFHRFANIYFISIVLLNWIPEISAFGKEIAMLPVMFVLGVTAIKDLFEDRRRHNSDKRINNSSCRVYDAELKRYVKMKWRDMRVGDFVHLSCNEMIPADILILRTSDPNGLCYIETMNLDGESNLKQRQVIRDYVDKQSTFQPLDFVSEIQVGAPTTKIYQFNGYITHPNGVRIPVTKENLLLRDCVLKNTDFIEGIVVYAGRETKAMLNNGGPRHKRTGLEKLMNLEVMWCVVILAIMCIVGATGSSLWLSSYSDPSVPFAIHPSRNSGDNVTTTLYSPVYDAFLAFLTFIIILQIMIPLSLYVTIELTKLMQVYHIQNDVELYDPETNKRIECRAMNIPEDLGQIQYVFSDKTGTLTENSMVFRRCTIGAIDYNHSPSLLPQPPPPPLPNANDGERVGGSRVEPPLKVNGGLSELLGNLSLQLPIETGDMVRNYNGIQGQKVHDFFMILAVCNTVVVAKYPHHDKMNASGLIVDTGGNGGVSANMSTNSTTSRLSTIRETLDSSLPSTSSSNSSSSRTITNNNPTTIHLSNMSTNTPPSNMVTSKNYMPLSSISSNIESNIPPSLISSDMVTSSVSSNMVTSSMSSNTPSNMVTSSMSSNTPSDMPSNMVTSSMSSDMPPSNMSSSEAPINMGSTPPSSSYTKLNSTPSSSSGVSISSGVTSSSGVTKSGDGLLLPSSRWSRRPGRLEFFTSSRPLSPISSSAETTPTESPAQRPRRLPLPSFVGGFRKTLNISSGAPSTPTPSPSEIRPIFEAESPDELALVEAAYAYDCKLLKRTPNFVRVAMPGEGLVEYEILHTFPFDSVRKRMSIVLKSPNTDSVILYCKGADSSIFPRLKYTHDPVEIEMRSRTEVNINNYAREGLRILVMAKREISVSDYSSWARMVEESEREIEGREERLVSLYSLLERELELVGATGIEDKLQEGVPRVIEALRKAGIVVWVLTGDKQETAVNIAYSCSLFSSSMDIIKLNARSKGGASESIKFYTDQIGRLGRVKEPVPGPELNLAGLTHARTPSSDNPPLTGRERALVVDGKTLTYILDQHNSNLLEPFLNLSRHCSAVLCCRATPLQKAFIVSSVKDHLKMRTLAIGDGANDVSMIQRADIGVGISGKEGMQAVMASDFAISKFKYLERLLLVHGHWCYDRLARMILYFFYKNAAFVFVIFWYQLLNGWSGSVMIDQMYLMVFNLFFTALPPMAMGIYDQDASDEMLLSVPKLYREGRLRKTHTTHSFWWNMLDSLYASIVIFFVSYGAYKGSDIGMIEFGTTITVSCMFTMLVIMAIETKSWTILHIASVVGSIIVFYSFALIYNSICSNFLGIQTPCKVIQDLMGTFTHWLVIFLTVVLATLPRFVYLVTRNSIYPNDVTKALVLQRRRQRSQGQEFFVSWSRSTSSSSVFKEKASSWLCWRKIKVHHQTHARNNIPTVT